MTKIIPTTTLAFALALGAATALTVGSAPARASTNDHVPPMLQGGDATRGETGDIHALFVNNEAIRRTVTNLPNGIRTVTESDDPQVAAIIKRHVDDMAKRVAEKRDPGLPIESPALRAIFENYDKIATNIEQTETGVIVTQTSADAATVALLQKHAGEVTAFVEDGMEAAHTAMMQNMHNGQGRAMGGMGRMRDMGQHESMQANRMRGGMRGNMQGDMANGMGPMRMQMMQRMHRMNGAGATGAPADDHSNH